MNFELMVANTLDYFAFGPWLVNWITRWGWPSIILTLFSVLFFIIGLTGKKQKHIGLFISGWLLTILAIIARILCFKLSMSYCMTPYYFKAMWYLDIVNSSLVIPLFFTAIMGLLNMKKGFIIYGKLIYALSILAICSLFLVVYTASITAYHIFRNEDKTIQDIGVQGQQSQSENSSLPAPDEKK